MNYQYIGPLRRLVAGASERTGVTDQRILDAIMSVPRHMFIEEVLWPRAYSDDALPIGFSQTISKVSTVMMMTAALEPQPTDHVLEVGTGSGYQAAVLSHLCAEIHSVERIAGLSIKARNLLHRLHAFNVKTRVGDGAMGWPEVAPFDKIIVTAAADRLQTPLLEQLKVGGKLVAPVEEGEEQVLRLVVRKGEDKWEELDLETCRFVPLVSREG